MSKPPSIHSAVLLEVTKALEGNLPDRPGARPTSHLVRRGPQHVYVYSVNCGVYSLVCTFIGISDWKMTWLGCPRMDNLNLHSTDFGKPEFLQQIIDWVTVYLQRRELQDPSSTTRKVWEQRELANIDALCAKYPLVGINVKRTSGVAFEGRTGVTPKPSTYKLKLKTSATSNSKPLLRH